MTAIITTRIFLASTLTVPANTSPPFLTGLGKVGQALTANQGGWAGSPTSYSYQWNRDGVPISGATASNYTLITADGGHAITVSVAATSSMGTSAPVTSVNPQFAVYKAPIGGSSVVLMASDPLREINHFRPSPVDSSKIAATQYNKIGGDGFARETGDYTNTQINLYDLAAGTMTVIAPPATTKVAAGCSWAPDGTAIFWTTNNTPSGKHGIARYLMSTKVTSTFYDPVDLNMGDHEMNPAGTAFVMAGAGGSIYVLYGGIRTRLTIPPPGSVDTDAHWSPDGTQISLIRNTGSVFNLVVVDVGPAPSFANLAERTIPAPNSPPAFDGPATFLPDTTVPPKLLAWHINPSDFSQNTVFTIAPDGTGRTSIPLIPQAILTEPYWNGTSEFYVSAAKMPILP